MPRALLPLALPLLFLAALLFAARTGGATALSATAEEQAEGLCAAAGRAAAAATGVPESVLSAISLTETGRVRRGALRPWPWTVNMEGAGKWFDNREEALAYVRANHDRGARSYDVGCFQTGS